MNIDTQVACRGAPRRAEAVGALASRQNARLVLAALALTCCSGFASAEVLPTDARPLCTFEPGELAGWFETGAVTLDGAVKPKDSLNFSANKPPNQRNCNFHKWSEQMFLWLTSPAPGGGRVFQSPDFYRVSVPGTDRKRTLVRNMPHSSRFCAQFRAGRTTWPTGRTLRLDGRKQFACILRDLRQ